MTLQDVPMVVVLASELVFESGSLQQRALGAATNSGDEGVDVGSKGTKCAWQLETRGMFVGTGEFAFPEVLTSGLVWWSPLLQASVYAEGIQDECRRLRNQSGYRRLPTNKPGKSPCSSILSDLVFVLVVVSLDQ